MKLILIHGRDQQGKDPQELRKTWIDTWEKGLTKSNLTIPDIPMLFPFYGDVLDSLVTTPGMETTIAGVIARGAASTFEAQFFETFLLEIAENASITEAEIDQNYSTPYKEKGPLNWEWVQAILQTLDQRTGFGEFSIKKFTYDVFVYLTMPGVKREINEFVTSAFDNEPTVVVGHSLGSVVGYNVLSKHPGNVKKYITVGSPLGLRAIKSKLDTPICMPPCVKAGWYNAYDERDVVALNPLNKKYFDITPAIENKNDVKNHTKNRHGIEGYLDDKEVAKAIYDALQDAD